MKISTERLKEIIKEELENINESEFNPSERLPPGYKMPPENKATEAMKLLSQLRSLTTEEWSPEAAASFDALLNLLQEIEEDLNINP